MRTFETTPVRKASRLSGTAAAALFLCFAVFSTTAEAERLRDDAKPVKESIRLSSGAVGEARTQSASACTLSEIRCNTTVVGELTSDDCPLGDNTYYDIWTFHGTAGQHVEITMTAPWDTYLLLYNAAGMKVREDDDSGGGPNGTNAKITFEINMTGTWTIRANSYDEFQTGAYSLELQCSSVEPPPTCTATPTSLCLNGSRFRVSVIFSAPGLGINNSPAQALPLTSDTGYFWFFSANNVELVIKVVDGRAFNQNYWVFYGALSDVEYTITVTDTVTNAVKTYRNSPGNLASVADVAAFPGGVAGATSAPASAATGFSMTDFVRSQSGLVSGLVGSSASEACVSDAFNLCLNSDRFHVRVIFSAPNLGISNAPAQTVPLTSDTGYFWFFSANNVELVIKAVDGRGFNGYFWVFYGALSDVEYTITVTDTVTNAVKTYRNSPGNLASVADVAAFQ